MAGARLQQALRLVGRKADALVFTARRLRAERLAMVFAAREGEAALFQAADAVVSRSDPAPLAGLSRRCPRKVWAIGLVATPTVNPPGRDRRRR